MINTDDIYRFIENELEYEGYFDIKDVPVEVIEQKINKYLRWKLNESDETLDNNTLLRRLESFLDIQFNKEILMDNFIFYLLYYLSMMQDFEIIWENEDVDTPYLKASIFVPGSIHSLVTCEHINHIDIFNFVLNEIKFLVNDESRGI